VIEDITVHVRSVKVLSGKPLTNQPYPVKKGYSPYETSKSTTFKTKIKSQYNYVLLDDQKSFVDEVKHLIEKYGQGNIRLKVVDVTKSSDLERFISECFSSNAQISREV